MSTSFEIEYNGEKVKEYYILSKAQPKDITIIIDHPDFTKYAGRQIVIFKQFDNSFGYSIEIGQNEEAYEFAKLVADKPWAKI